MLEPMGWLRRRWWAIAIVLGPATWVGACSSFDGEAAPSPEAGVPDVAVDGDAPPGITRFDDGANWSSFSLQSIAKDQTFTGAGYDGRYLYLSPASATSPVVVRYDTTAPFGTATSWESFDVTTIGGSSSHAPIFDGKWMYFVPNHNVDPNDARSAYRYDTTRPFATGSSWETLSLDAFPPSGIASSAGAVFDGKRIAVMPYEKPDAGGHALAYATFDVSGKFTEPAAWKTTTVEAGTPLSLSGAALLDGSVYAADFSQPILTRASSDLSVVERFDMTPTAFGGAFGVIADGRYVYVVPWTAIVPNANGRFVRYDTTKPFDASTSYEEYELTAVNKALTGFTRGTFDGRFVYLTAYSHGTFVRFDTTQPLGVGTAYETFDLGVLGVNVGTREGAVYDGEFVYYPPLTGGVVLRFRARDRRSPWPATTSTF